MLLASVNPTGNLSAVRMSDQIQVSVQGWNAGNNTANTMQTVGDIFADFVTYLLVQGNSPSINRTKLALIKGLIQYLLPNHIFKYL